MNFLAKRRFRKHGNAVVRLSVLHFDRPTDLKEAFQKLDIEQDLLREQVHDAVSVVSKFEAVADDIRLAYLRTLCSKEPSNYTSAVADFPKLLKDSRAISSIDLYKNRTLNQILGIEEQEYEELQSSSIILFDDSMFENINPTEFETILDDDFGLIEYADQPTRNLNQLRDRIQNLIYTESLDSIYSLSNRILQHLIKEGYNKRATSDFFVAALRAIGEMDAESGVEYGKKYSSVIIDHRAMRSLVVFLRRKGEFLDALRLLHHPQFKHDDKTVVWVEELMGLHKDMLLDGKLKPRYDLFGSDYENLQEYMITLYESMDNDLEIARYNYGYALRVHKSTPDRLLASSVIEWGEIILDAAETYSDTVSIHVSNAYINLGEITKAINILESYGNPDSVRIKSKVRGYNDLLHLKDNGFEAKLDIPTDDFKPIPKRVMYVLHNSLPYNSGGYASRGHGLMCGVKSLGWDVQVITRRGYPHDRKGMNELPTDDLQIIDEIPYHRLIELERGYGQINIASYLQAYAEDLAEKVRELRPSILHAASNHINGLVVNAVAKHFNIPSIYEVRGLWEITRISRQPEFEGSEYFQMMSNLEANSASEATYVFAITHALADEMRTRIGKKCEIGFLPNGVHANRFLPKKPNYELKSRLDIPRETVVLGYIGSVVSYEGLDLLIESLPIVKELTDKPFKLMIVGDGAYMEKLQTMVDDMDLGNDVLFTGRVPHEEVEDYYSIVDIAPFPRLPQPVTEMVSPLKPFEAMAMEKAVLSSNVQALSEIVQHGKTGILFEKGNSEDLGRKLGMLISDSELRLRLGKSGRDWVVENRDWNSISESLDKAYSNLQVRN